MVGATAVALILQAGYLLAIKDAPAEIMPPSRKRIRVASGWLSMGPRVKTFEKSFACYHGVEHAVATSSGTAALHLSLMALNIQPGQGIGWPPALVLE